MKNILLIGGSTHLGKEVVKSSNNNFYNLTYNFVFDEELVVNINSISNLISKFDKNYFQDLIFIASIQNSKSKFLKGLWLNLFLPLVLLSKFKFKKIIFINSYWVLLRSKKFDTYTTYKKLTNSIFNFFSFYSKYLYCSIYLGDLYYEQDDRDKLHTYLKFNELNSEVNLNSNKDKLIYPVSSKLVTSFITKFINNDFFIPSNNIRINAFENKITLVDYISLFKKARHVKFNTIFNEFEKIESPKKIIFDFYLKDFKFEQNLINYFSSLK